MNVARLNFSHGTQDDHARVIERVHHLSSTLGVPVAILQDLAGPKVRVGEFAVDTVDLVEGKSFTLTTSDVVGDETRVSVSYARLPFEVKPGQENILKYNLARGSSD